MIEGNALDHWSRHHMGFVLATGSPRVKWRLKLGQRLSTVPTDEHRHFDKFIRSTQRILRLAES